MELLVDMTYKWNYIEEEEEEAKGSSEKTRILVECPRYNNL